MHVLSRFRVLEPGGGRQSKAWHSLTARILFFFCFVFALRYILRWWHLGFPETHCQVTLQRVDGCQVGEGLRAPPLLMTCGQHPFFWNVKECLLLSVQFQGLAGNEVGIRGGFSPRRGFIWKGILLRDFRDNFPLVVCLCRGLILALWEGEFFVVRDAHL